MPAEQDAQIDLGVVTGGGPARDEPAAADEALEAAVPRGGADVFDDDVDAAALGEILDLRNDIVGGVIGSLAEVAASGWQPTPPGGLTEDITLRHRTRTIDVPIVNHDNNQHSFNENIRIQNLWDGIEVMAALLAM